MVIREIVKEDLKGLNELFIKVIGCSTPFGKMQTAFDAMQNDESYKVLVVQIEGKIIGMAMGLICYNLIGDAQPFIRIENMVIEETVDKELITLLLVKKIKEIAKDNEIEKVIFNQEILFEEKFISLLKNKKCS